MTGVRHRSVANRLLAAAAGLTLGAVGSLAGMGPAIAQTPSPSDPVPIITGEVTDCVAGFNEWVITWVITSSETDLVGNINFVEADPNTALDVILTDQTLPAHGEDGLVVRQTSVPSGTTEATLTIEVLWNEGDDQFFTTGEGSVAIEGSCEPGAPDTVSTFAVSCDLLVFVARNDSAEEGLSFGFQPSHDTEHGPVAGLDALLEQDPTVSFGEVAGVPLPDSTALSEPDSVEAGAVADAPIVEVGETVAHGIAIFEGISIEFGSGVGDNTGGTVITWDQIASALDCPADEGSPAEEGSGGEAGGPLPNTGSPVLVLAAVAVALLTVGAGLYLVGRRRIRPQE